MAKKPALGRGLGEILGEVREAYENNMGEKEELVAEIDIDLIAPNPYQPRKIFQDETLEELSHSIKEYGLLQPILVYKESKKYILIAGERRLRASKLIGATTIKAIVADIDLARLREIALIENIQREDLNPIDLAYAYEDLIKTCNLTHDELAERIQKSRAQITNTLRLLQLVPQVQDFLIQGKITQGHAKILVSLNEKEQKKIANTIVGQKLSVRESEKIVQKLKQPPETKSSPQSLKSNNLELLDKIKTILLENRIKFDLRGDKISISLRRREEAENFLDIITR